MNESDRRIHLAAVREEQGEETCVRRFGEIAARNRTEAVRLLNEEEMTYPCLFVLRPSIDRWNLQQRMRARYAIALEITKQVLNIQENRSSRNYLADAGDRAHDALIWMLRTGSAEEYPSEEYQQVLDVVVSVLINLYQDTEILPDVAALIFARRKRGQNVHELIWAYFRSHDARALALAAERLPQADEAEAEFICDLLGMSYEKPIDGPAAYERYSRWLRENESRLVFNEENKQYTSRPVVCRMDQPAEEGRAT